MHESQLAKQLLTIALEEAAGAQVLRVVGTIAETEALRPEALNWHFQAHARGTRAEGATLELALTHVRARCKACQQEYLPDHHLTLCPTCSSTDGELLGDTGVFIEAVVVA